MAATTLREPSWHSGVTTGGIGHTRRRPAWGCGDRATIPAEAVQAAIRNRARSDFVQHHLASSKRSSRSQRVGDRDLRVHAALSGAGERGKPRNRATAVLATASDEWRERPGVDAWREALDYAPCSCTACAVSPGKGHIQLWIEPASEPIGGWVAQADGVQREFIGQVEVTINATRVVLNRTRRRSVLTGAMRCSEWSAGGNQNPVPAA